MILAKTEIPALRSELAACRDVPDVVILAEAEVSALLRARMVVEASS